MSVTWSSHDLFVQEMGKEGFFKNLPVLELIQSIRTDYSLFARYQHSAKLVDQINQFARTDCDLPPDWEKRVDPKTNKVNYLY